MTTEWPTLPLSTWTETRETFHLWTQIVGKVRLKLAPFVNHWWNTTLYVSARGLTTSLMPAGAFGLEIEFDLLGDVLGLRTTDGRTREVALAPKSVADFYAETTAELRGLGVDVHISARPNEVADAIPFAGDNAHHAYDADATRAFWSQLVNADRVFKQFRARFIGKISPVHFFWGAPDLAVTRFSGRPAPRHPGGVVNCPDEVQVLAYSHEVSSCGFWPGGDGEGMFYAYAYPAPDGFGSWPVQPTAAYYDDTLGEFVLPYTDVRTANDPDAYLLEFLQSTYEAAADLANWDRAALELRD